jgi:hypothetical protein
VIGKLEPPKNKVGWRGRLKQESVDKIMTLMIMMMTIWRCSIEPKPIYPLNKGEFISER